LLRYTDLSAADKTAVYCRGVSRIEDRECVTQDISDEKHPHHAGTLNLDLIAILFGFRGKAPVEGLGRKLARTWQGRLS